MSAEEIATPTKDKLSTYRLGQRVKIRAFGRDYWGEVVKVGRKLVHVKFVTGTGMVHTRTRKP